MHLSAPCLTAVIYSMIAFHTGSGLPLQKPPPLRFTSMVHFVPAFCCHLQWPSHSRLHPAPQVHTGLFACLSSESLVPLRPARVLWEQQKGRKRNKLLPSTFWSRVLKSRRMLGEARSEKGKPHLLTLFSKGQKAPSVLNVTHLYHQPCGC